MKLCLLDDIFLILFVLANWVYIETSSLFNLFHRYLTYSMVICIGHIY